MMQAVILAGGMGTRLRPFTHITPKLMLKIYGKPFLEHHIASLREQGIKNIVILVGHLGDKIKDYFADGSEFGVNIKYSEDDQLGTGGAIKKAYQLLADEFIVINGDTYLPINYNDLIRRFREGNNLGMITVYDNKNRIVGDNVFIRDGRLMEYKRAGAPHFTHLDAGVGIFRKEVLKLTDKDRFSMEDDFYPVLIEMKKLDYFLTSQKFFDIHVMEKIDSIRKCFDVK